MLLSLKSYYYDSVGRPRHQQASIVSVSSTSNTRGDGVEAAVTDNSLYSTYDQEPLSLRTPTYRHCLACDRYGHTARNCPGPKISNIVSNYGIYKELLKYCPVTTDDSVIVASGPLITEEPIDQPDVQWPKFPVCGNFMEETYENGAPSRKKMKRQRGANKNTKENIMGNTIATEDTLVPVPLGKHA